jgi:hypothetical protein
MERNLRQLQKVIFEVVQIHIMDCRSKLARG